MGDSTAPGFWVALACLQAVSLGFAIRIGYAGPRYEHRRGPFSWPDMLWTCPLAAILIWWIDHPPLPQWDVAAASLCAPVAALVTIFGALALRAYLAWTERIPAHLRPLTFVALGASRLRALLRCTAWAGLLAAVVGVSAPDTQLRWIIAPILGQVLLGVIGFGGALWLAVRRSRWGAPILADVNRPWDIFVSYRSDNAPVVRGVVDRLLSAGVRVWFAEYMIRFHSRDRFQDAIDAGIARSHRAVIFSNDRFVASVYCRKELEQLLSRRGSDARGALVEIRIPDEPETRRRYGPLMDGIPWMEHREDQTSVLRFICKHAKLPLPAVGPAPECGDRREVNATIDGSPFSIDVPLTWRAASQEWSTLATGDVCSPRFRRRLGSHTASFNIVVGPDPGGRQSVREPKSQADERVLYNDLRDFAMVYLAKTGSECAGVHLFWLGGFSHLLLTYWQGTCWHRRYCIVLPHPQSMKSTELLIVFWFSGPFRELLKYTSAMDDIVSTLRWNDRGPGSLSDAATRGQGQQRPSMVNPTSSPAIKGRPAEFGWTAKQLTDQAFRVVDHARSRADVEAALELLDASIRGCPAYARAHSERAHVLGKLGRFEEAIEAARTALGLDPHNAKYASNFIAIQIDAITQPNVQCAPTAARSLLAQVDDLIAMYPNYPTLYFSKADLLAITGAPQSAWEHYLALGGRAYYTMSYMASGLPATETHIARTLEESTWRCLEYARRNTASQPTDS